jgi:UDP-3-O-[3-hydroxymyristoyl] glucosamine N-acyltransferase
MGHAGTLRTLQAVTRVSVLANVMSMASSDPLVHPTAIVEDGAAVGSGTRVWHHAHIRSLATVGQDCVVGKNVYVDTLVIVGDRCKLQNNVCVYHGVTIGNDVFVGPSATFTNDLVPRAFNVDWKVVETHVRDGASIGANATIVCGVTLGRYSMVAAGATVTHDVAAHQLVAGTPARHRGWVCRCGKVVSRDDAAPEQLVCPGCAG